MELLFDIPFDFMPRLCAGFAATVLGCVLAWASVVDARFRIVPDAAVISGILAWAAAFVFSAICDAVGWQGGRSVFSWMRGIAAGGVGASAVSAFALMLDFLLSHRAGRSALGMGDVKLLFVMGLYCGTAGAFVCLAAACVFAVSYSAVRFARDRVFAMLQARGLIRAPFPAPFDGTFPFVPFLSASLFLLAMAHIIVRGVG